jgi:NAD-dependent deacetylase
MTLATPEAFAEDPRRVWQWYDHRRLLVDQAAPNAGHWALAAMAERVPEFTLITQNVDGLHQQAGSLGVIELHGSLRRARCIKDGTRFSEWSSGDDDLPRCRYCGALLRPDIVWFGEMLPEAALNTAMSRAHSAELLFSVGTSALVHPAAAIPLQALAMGVPVAEVNLEPTALTSAATWSLRGPAGELLPALLQATWPD